MTASTETNYEIKIEQLSKHTYRWRVGRARGTAGSRRAAIRGAEKYIKETLNTSQPEIVKSKFKKVLKDPSILFFPEPTPPKWSHAGIDMSTGFDPEPFFTSGPTLQEYKITQLEKRLEELDKRIETFLFNHQSDGSTFEEFCITCEEPYPCEVRVALKPESINTEEEHENDEDEEY